MQESGVSKRVTVSLSGDQSLEMLKGKGGLTMAAQAAAAPTA